MSKAMSARGCVSAWLAGPSASDFGNTVDGKLTVRVAPCVSWSSAGP
jgi:hypothetical protein